MDAWTNIAGVARTELAEPYIEYNFTWLPNIANCTCTVFVVFMYGTVSHGHAGMVSAKFGKKSLQDSGVEIYAFPYIA